MLKWSSLVISCLLLFSCGGDDDVCISGEATPRMKVKFKSIDNRTLTLDSLYIEADYGNGFVNVVTKAKVDSVLLPLRIDSNGFTELWVHRTKNGLRSKLKVAYTTQSKYVSPACGFKRLYHNLTGSLITSNPVTRIELNTPQIINEDPTHLYLVF